MALQVKALRREYRFKRDGSWYPLQDIPGLAPEQVIRHYAGTFPELTAATIGEIHAEADAVVYDINAHLGSKG